MKTNDFAVFILTHGRPDKVLTHRTLRRQNYTGKIFIVIDDEDKYAMQYHKHFGNHLVMFDKAKAAQTTDEFGDFNDRRAIIYARNACFELAEEFGIKYFLELDDDYSAFDYRLYIDGEIRKAIKDLDKFFDSVLDYYKSIDAKSIALSQAGDFIGGIDNGSGLFRFSKRKAMNSFFCSTDRPFKFIGRINEDVNTYTSFQSKGNLFLTIQNASITQQETQRGKGGMTDIYKDSGTYVKSFYTVICQPSSVTIELMHTKHRRLHHSIDWDKTVPCIIDERHCKC